ncbi:ISAs1 family transposase [Halosquirtibacter laminarini]|uniref:ISAs1 family transposase n=1 Tax=Halosquirtibacter laminarini TaxID=3374600 RepID=A0AC61NKV4_9BACT|nr:ISAs1 family transposase [Prolixibacteraceae bacterium]
MKENLVDPRDTRGKKHDLEFVLVGITLSIITGNTLLSEISRFLENYHSILRKIVGLPKCKPISYSQLRRIISFLASTNYQEVQSSYFGWQNTKDDDDWISLDGKELRGTIAKSLGQKRGLNIVYGISQKDKISTAATFYEGAKESEITTVRELLNDLSLASSNLTFDALHTQFETLEKCESAKGIYIAQVKNNQKNLNVELRNHEQSSVEFMSLSIDNKGHGRKETRTYSFYDIRKVTLDEKWVHCGIKSLIKVDRDRLIVNSNKRSIETSYYISNRDCNEIHPHKYAKAIKGHWTIEMSNYIRDVLFSEDNIRCSNRNQAKGMAILITTVVNLIQRNKPKNIKAQREKFLSDIRKMASLFVI